jgi:transcriptional regulator with XRE-family HTH domain
MLLAELCKSAGVTQEELALSLGIKQPTLSRLESQNDMQISTLRRVIESLGGELEIIAHLPDGDVRLSQFQRAALSCDSLYVVGRPPMTRARYHL